MNENDFFKWVREMGVAAYMQSLEAERRFTPILHHLNQNTEGMKAVTRNIADEDTPKQAIRDE